MPNEDTAIDAHSLALVMQRSVLPISDRVASSIVVACTHSVLL